jgi:hypothetical protein
MINSSAEYEVEPLSIKDLAAQPQLQMKPGDDRTQHLRPTLKQLEAYQFPSK